MIKRLFLSVVLLLFLISDSYSSTWYINSSGQSVSVGTYSCPALSITQPFFNVMLDVNNEFTPLIEYSFILNGYTNCETPLSGMANTITFLSAGQTQKVITTHHGVPGYSLNSLKKGTTPYNNSLTAITNSRNNTIALGETFEFIATTWTQGETDYQWSYLTYENALRQLQIDYETDINNIIGGTGTIPIITSQIGKWYAGYTGVPIAQWKASVKYPGKIYCATSLYHLDHSATGAHLTNSASRRLGEYYGKVINKIKATGSWVPLSPKNITISNQSIFLDCNVPSPPLVIDDSIGVVSNRGFKFVDNSGNTPVITSVSILDADTIKIDLSFTPTGSSKRLQYAISGFSNNKYSWGNIRDSDNTIGYYSATPLYNWMVIFDEEVLQEETINNISYSRVRSIQMKIK